MSLGQQTYEDNKQLDCYKNYSSTNGYVCNGLRSSCDSYLTFRSNPPYNTAITIGYLLNSDASAIAKLNNIFDIDVIPTNTVVIVPVNCTCSGEYYQHNVSYTIKYTGETYFSVANNTYQGLTSCQAMMTQNPYDSRNLSAGLNVVAPLRCACPTANQTAAGFRYLLNYMVATRDTVGLIAQSFGVDDFQSVLDANELTSASVIYPYTTILVPLKAVPKFINQTAASPPPPPPPSVVVGNGSDKSSTSKWVFVGTGIGAAILLLLALSGFLIWRSRRSSSMPRAKPITDADQAPSLPKKTGTSWSFSSEGVRFAVESLTLYEFSELERATGYFSEANRIRGSVYRGSFKGDNAAIKVVKGNVSTAEINVLKHVNHSNIVRMSGFCVHQGNTYLVYEYAENGSLSEWLHSKKTTITSLGWKQRVQIAYDVAEALNYLHNYINPPYIHKNLKSSNVLLDVNMRAKVANFGLARTVTNEDEGGFQMTRHVVGTHGYMAPEYVENGVITPRLDVFAFGVILLELLSGKEATVGEKGGEESLLSASVKKVFEGENVREKLRGFVDPSLMNEYPLDLVYSMAQLGNKCVFHDLNGRPSMGEVSMTLSKILSSSLEWDPSDELERSRSLSHGR